jgi:hypothetical protein
MARRTMDQDLDEALLDHEAGDSDLVIAKEKNGVTDEALENAGRA